MKITNQHGLPEPLYRALSYDGYDSRGDISVTSLILPPRQTQLRKRHDADITIDASDNIWLLLGSAIHDVLEKSFVKNALIEERLYKTVNGWIVTGKPDLWEPPSLLSDYKVTSQWKFVFGENIEWEQQLNLYAHLYRQSNFAVEQLQIVGILRDWSKNKAMGNPDLPNIPFYIMRVPLWEDAECVQFLEERVALHQENVLLPDLALPYCTPEEKWQRQTTYAVKKKGRKTALRVLNSHEEATKWMLDSGGDFVEMRRGNNVKCEDYCVVKDFCNQYTEENNV